MKKSLGEIVGDYTMKGSRRYDAPGNIRVGMKVIGNRGNVLTDEESTTEIPTAVCVIVKRADGKVLAVTRNGDENDLNLPGGMIELGEKSEEAARRELWEETGLIATDMTEVYRGVGRTRFVVVYKANDATGNVRSSPEGLAMWVDPKRLLNGTFGDLFLNLMKLGYV